jgi:phi13 family phage major tail protein
MANKVEFGISQLHIGTYTTSDQGDVVLGAPYHLPGARSFGAEESSEQNDYYADNIPYWSGYSGGKTEGDLVVALFTDEFKKLFLGYKETMDGGLGAVKGAYKPNVYVAFQVEGDVEPVRAILYNGSFGNITREYATIEENKEPVEESIPTTFTGDNKTGLTKVCYRPGQAGYDTLFTNPPVPALKPDDPSQ